MSSEPDTNSQGSANPDNLDKPSRRLSNCYSSPYPPRTLADWVEARSRRIAENQEYFADGRKEKRGDLAAKLEDKIHSVIEAITPEKIQKATLAQSGVFIGIGIDKLARLHGEGLEPDPATELCKILGISRSQLPDTLELQPGEELPPGFSFAGANIDVEAEPVLPQSMENPSQGGGADTTESDSKLLESLDADDSAN